MMVYALQQGLSLRFQNQAVALVCGISGSFLGILSLLFPPALTRCVPWGYYGLLSLVGMNWNPDTRFTWFYWEWPSPRTWCCCAYGRRCSWWWDGRCLCGRRCEGCCFVA